MTFTPQGRMKRRTITNLSHLEDNFNGNTGKMPNVQYRNQIKFEVAIVSTILYAPQGTPDYEVFRQWMVYRQT